MTIAGPRATSADLIGRSAAMRERLDQVRRFASTDANVLATGRAEQILGISRKALWAKRRRYGLR